MKVLFEIVIETVCKQLSISSAGDLETDNEVSLFKTIGYVGRLDAAIDLSRCIGLKKNDSFDEYIIIKVYETK